MLKKSRVYKGIEYVQVSELPADQQDLITKSSSERDLIIKILVDGKILNDCIQFKDYEDWYARKFSGKTIRFHEPQEAKVNLPQIKTELAIEKV